jgi:hypothetical protein
LDGPFPPDPEQACDVEVDLIDQRQIFVALGILDLIDSNGVDLVQYPVLKSEGDNVLYGVENLFP